MEGSSSRTTPDSAAPVATNVFVGGMAHTPARRGNL